MERVETFIVGNGNFPKWFNDELAKGRGHVNRDEYDGTIKSIIVYSIGGSSKAAIGDVIMKTRSGMIVIPRAKAKEYGYI